uniref:Uncharacterized protein n=1 Tax=Lepeophtheirus salmonis TaxID=72036 RepID=A0A0K2VJ70_LEPSM
MEQMTLLFKSPNARRYLLGLLSVGFLRQNVSTALYNQINSWNLLTIPFPKHLRALSSVLTIVETGLPVSTVKYLGAKIKYILE